MALDILLAVAVAVVDITCLTKQQVQVVQRMVVVVQEAQAAHLQQLQAECPQPVVVPMEVLTPVVEVVEVVEEPVSLLIQRALAEQVDQV